MLATEIDQPLIQLADEISMMRDGKDAKPKPKGDMGGAADDLDLP